MYVSFWAMSEDNHIGSRLARFWQIFSLYIVLRRVFLCSWSHVIKGPPSKLFNIGEL